MKRLYLLRHAEAAPAQGFADKERHLTERGHGQALALGKLMAQKSYHPTHVLCSAANRTRQTYEGVAKNINAAVTEFTEKIYYGSTGDLFDLVQHLHEDIESALVVAHNPSIYELAIRLAGDEEEEHVNTLSRGYKPGTLTAFDCPIDRWASILPGKNKVVDVLDPALYFKD